LVNPGSARKTFLRACVTSTPGSLDVSISIRADFDVTEMLVISSLEFKQFKEIIDNRNGCVVRHDCLLNTGIPVQ
jgi:hypothetical protein